MNRTLLLVHLSLVLSHFMLLLYTFSCSYLSINYLRQYSLCLMIGRSLLQCRCFPLKLLLVTVFDLNACNAVFRLPERCGNSLEFAAVLSSFLPLLPSLCVQRLYLPISHFPVSSQQAFQPLHFLLITYVRISMVNLLPYLGFFQYETTFNCYSLEFGHTKQIS